MIACGNVRLQSARQLYFIDCQCASRRILQRSLKPVAAHGLIKNQRKNVVLVRIEQ